MSKELANAIESFGAANNLTPADTVYLLERCVKESWTRVYGEGYNLKFEYKNGIITLYRIVQGVDQIQDPKTEIEGKETILEKLSLEQLPRAVIFESFQNLKKYVTELNKNKEYDLYKDQVGEVFTCTIKKVLGRNTIVTLAGMYDGIIPYNLAIVRENFTEGSKIKCRLHEVKSSLSDYQLIFERRSADFLCAILEEHIPDIANGSVEIKAVAREPGSCAKVMVHSTLKSINAVGACIGFKGTRRNTVIQELLGEKVDFIPWDEDPVRRVGKCFHNIPILNVVFSSQTEVSVTVPDEFFARAIGRNGQSARLISRLLQFKVTVLTQTDYEEIRREHLLEKATHLETYGISPEVALDVMTRYGDNISAALDADFEEETKESLRNYVKDQLQKTREKYVEKGGDPKFFLSFPELSSADYFTLLEQGIGSLEILLQYSPEELEEATNIHREIFVLIQSNYK